MNTPRMIVRPSIILLQPHVGRFHACSDSDFQPTFWQFLVIKRCLRDVGLLLECLIKKFYVYKRIINTCSTYRSLYHTFTAICRQISCLRSQFPADFQKIFGHQVGVWQHVGATIVVVWHYIGV